MRQVVLDTETTGLEPADGHRIIEIGCVELINRQVTDRHYHQYLCPDRDIDQGALEVHGISAEFLQDSPRFAAAVGDFLDFIRDAELIIHNAPFDVGFINHELALLGSEFGRLDDYCGVLDSLQLARELHPGQKNSLDALCSRYSIDNSNRDLHGALLDAGLLAEVYLVMTGGQESLLLEVTDSGSRIDAAPVLLPAGERPNLAVIEPTAEEMAAHQARLKVIDEASDGQCVWYRLSASGDGAEETEESA